jgi:nitrile hydratase
LQPTGHTRLSGYARGKRGAIERVHAGFVFPDTNAAGRGENPQWVYAVRFEAAELFGSFAEPNACVHIDLFESYLEPEPRDA